MKNKIALIIVLALIIICIVIVIMLKNSESSNTIDNSIEEGLIQNSEIVKENTSITTVNENNESEEEMYNTLKISINNKIYIANLEQNETVKEFVNMLPQEFDMSELNGNEKYTYLDTKLPTDSYSPKRIEAGDIMRFGDNCLVVFYKSFDTPYNYTKIGHIENFDDLGNKNIIIKFEK